MAKKNAAEEELLRLESIKIKPDARVNEILVSLGSSTIKKPQSLKEILRRPEISYSSLSLLPGGDSAPELLEDVLTQIEMEVKYEGYIKRQIEQIEKFRKVENLGIPEDFSYDDIPGLSKEIIQKLSRVRPGSLGQASRISGITPAAISVLMVYLKRGNIEREMADQSFSS